MKYLWIGISVSETTKTKILEKNGKLLSGYVSQQSILEGLDALTIDMDSINSLQIAPDVMDKVEAETWSRNGMSVDVSIAYPNVKYVSNIIREKKLKGAARDWAKRNNDEEVIVFVYSMHTPFIRAALEIKQIVRKCKIILIVLDLPQYMDLSMSKTKAFLKSLDWNRIKKEIKRVDRFALYARPMAKYLNLSDGQWMVYEGSYDNSDIVPIQINKKRKAVMYSGLLDVNYGIPELVEAMELLDSTFELWLTGDGNAVPYIKEHAKKDNRIKFFGYLPSRKDLATKQSEAMMLISPRKDTNEASRYCFPSKLFEYMVSGNPVISCRLDGIPEEYFRYLIELSKVTPEEIATCITKVANMEVGKRAELGKMSRDFILQNKNKYVQAKKLLEFAQAD